MIHPSCSRRLAWMVARTLVAARAFLFSLYLFSFLFPLLFSGKLNGQWDLFIWQA